MRCRLHGGKSLSGPAAPAWRHGRYSRTLPTGLVRRYEESLADPELLALRDEIALLDAHTLELIATLSNSEGPALWQQLQELQSGLSAAVSQQDLRTIESTLTELSSLLQNGANDAKVWDSILHVIENRRRLVESERRRLVDMQQMITAEQALALVGRLQDIILRNVDDRIVIAAISSELRAIALTDPSESAR